MTYRWFARVRCETWLLAMLASSSLLPAAPGADGPPTNQLWAVSPALTLSLDESSAGSDWQFRFAQELAKNQGIFFDRLGPPAGYDLMRQGQIRGYGIYDEIRSRGVGAVERALQNSAQETALAMFPVDQWLEMFSLDKWSSLAQTLFEGSFGNTTEKEVADLSPSYSASESWWRQSGSDNTLRYGIRPRTAPYLYVASQIGHFEGRPALTIDARARYIPFNRIQTTFAATLALPSAFELSFSAVCEPLRASSTFSSAIRLQRVVGTGASACAVFVGLLRDASESAIVCGLSRPW